MTSTRWKALLRLYLFLVILIHIEIEAFSTTTTKTSSKSSVRTNNIPKNYNHPQQRRTRIHERRTSSALFTTSTAVAAQQQDGSASSNTQNNKQPIQLSMMEYTTTTSSSDKSTPILFLHGLLGSKRNFNSLATTLSHLLSDKNRPILGMDLRNHGESPTGESMSYDLMAHDVIHTLDQHFSSSSEENQKVVVVGHSMGGKVAASLALLYPERIDGLVVLDMAPAWYDGDCVAWSAVRDIVQSLATKVDMTSCTTKRDVDLQLRPILPDPALRAFVLTNIESSKDSSNNNSVDWSIPVSTLHHQLSTLAGFLELPEEVEYTGDVFFIAGGQSKFIRSTHLPEIQTYFPNHMITTIRGAGHWLHAEAPDDVLALLVKYLER